MAKLEDKVEALQKKTDSLDRTLFKYKVWLGVCSSVFTVLLLFFGLKSRADLAEIPEKVKADAEAAAKKQAEKVADDVVKGEAYKEAVQKLNDSATSAKQVVTEALKAKGKAESTDMQLSALKQHWESVNYPKDVLAKFDDKLRKMKVKTILEVVTAEDFAAKALKAAMAGIKAVTDKGKTPPPPPPDPLFSHVIDVAKYPVTFKAAVQVAGEGKKATKKLVDGKILLAYVIPLRLEGTSNPDAFADWFAAITDTDTVDFGLQAQRNGTVHLCLVIFYEEPTK